MRILVLLFLPIIISLSTTLAAFDEISTSSEVNVLITPTNQSLILGVFAYRSDDIMQSHFEPLVDYLNDALGDGLNIELKILDSQQMQEALRQNQLDFVLTNPGHYLVLRSQTSMSGVLATLVRRKDGVATSALGGVIIVRDESSIKTLNDIKGHRIAIPKARFLGGFQAQLYELQRHNIQKDQLEFIELLNQDQIIDAVLSGVADVGFVRTGMLEDWQLHGYGAVDQLRVINEQNLRGFPFRLSTRLYPEWPLLSLPHVDPTVVRRVANALFSLTSDHPAAIAAEIDGFIPAVDYASVENLARSIKAHPYDFVESIELSQLWQQYRTWLMTIAILFIALLISSSLIAYQALRLRRQRAILRSEQRKLQQMAYYDVLTNLPNRALLTDRLERSMALSRRSGKSLALVFLDLDGFKAVNDTHGHDIGDQLLIEVAKRLQLSMRETDTLARIGGDEFVLVLSDVSISSSKPLLERILSSVAEPFLINKLPLYVSASMGVVYYPIIDDAADRLMRHADQAMYQAKRMGKNRYAIFTETSEDQSAA
ncbi:diguanylate cyclase domain-containing protein [Nitrincola schmidtii]|uniref:diguanylate cyclase domain-containing protein n=1 Tax=Nitrincola schmidtii TaxID=1730894 RepID=UPI00124CAB34|nr:diguanylate cyclase [Nitrincola schmidtii]